MFYYKEQPYYITFVPGCSGNFIALLISLLQDPKKIVIDFPMGNAHHIVGEYGIVPTAPLMLMHEPIDWSDTFTEYPLAKNIVITVSANMHTRVQANFYFKNVMPGHTKEYIRQYWLEYPYTDTRVYNYDMLNIPQDVLIECFSRGDKHNAFPTPFYDKIEIPEPFKHNVFPIRFHDIIHNKDIVLSKLSEITGREITPHVIATYDKYLAAQEKLLSLLYDSVYEL